MISANGLVKVRYIGYGDEYDEWKVLEDIVELSDSSSSDEDSLLTATTLSVASFACMKNSLTVSSHYCGLRGKAIRCVRL